MTDASNGKKIQAFGNWSPRVSATYDLFGNGKTQVHASGSYFYDTKITLANSLGGLCHADRADVGTEPVERRLQHHRQRVLLERRQPGRPGAGQRADRHATSSSSRFVNGVLHAGRQHRRSERARSAARVRRSSGMQHELIPNLAVGGGLHLPQVRSRHGDLHDRLPARRSAVPAVGDLRAARTYTDPVTGIKRAVLRGLRRLLRPSGSAASP